MWNGDYTDVINQSDCLIQYFQRRWSFEEMLYLHLRAKPRSYFGRFLVYKSNIAGFKNHPPPSLADLCRAIFLSHPKPPSSSSPPKVFQSFLAIYIIINLNILLAMLTPPDADPTLPSSAVTSRVTLHLGHLPSKKNITAPWPRTPTRVCICAFLMSQI